MLQLTVQCDKFQIDDVADTASKFMRGILGLTRFEYALSDESDLDDFSMMSSLNTGDLSWDQFVIDKIRADYGITLTTTRVNLVWLFNQIEQSAIVVYH